MDRSDTESFALGDVAEAAGALMTFLSLVSNSGNATEHSRPDAGLANR